MKFSIRDLLLVTVIVALAVGWWVDRAKLSREIRRLTPPPQPYYSMGPGPDFLSPKLVAPAKNPPKK
jgi:hypothetical protein